MIDRYSRPEMANIWTEENKYRAWLEVEILADEAWAELGEIPKEDVALIREKKIEIPKRATVVIIRKRLFAAITLDRKSVV